MAPSPQASLFRFSVPPKLNGSHTAASANSTAHTNSAGIDLVQVINTSGKVVWSLDSAGVVHVNPSNPSGQALIGRFEGGSFAQAFPQQNGAAVDFYQIHDGSNVVFRIDAQGNSHVNS